MVAVDALMEGTDEAKRADLEALIDGREPPSAIRARVEQSRREEDEQENQRMAIVRANTAAKIAGKGGSVVRRR